MNKSVGLVYHYWASYREPVLHKLMEANSPSFYIYSDFKTSPSSIKGVDPVLASRSVEEGGLRWFELKNIWLGSTFLWQIGVVRLVLSGRHDSYIFLGSMYYISTWVALLICRYKRIPCYLWTHGVTTDKNSLREKIRRLFYRQAKGLFLYGVLAKKRLLRSGFKEETLVVIYNSLDFARQQQLIERIDQNTVDQCVLNKFRNPDAPLIVFIGRLTNRKKLDLMIHALVKLEKNGLLVNLAFVGDGEAQHELYTLAESVLVKSEVVFFGAMYSEEDVAPVLLASALCVSPGNVGLSAIHAMGYGVPVVSHNNPENQGPEFEAIIEGKTGSLFREDDIEDLATKITYWIFGEKKRQVTREACIELIRAKYTPEIQVDLIVRQLLSDNI